jgi:hypothetical protein
VIFRRFNRLHLQSIEQFKSEQAQAQSAAQAEITARQQAASLAMIQAGAAIAQSGQNYSPAIAPPPPLRMTHTNCINSGGAMSRTTY